MEKMKLYSFDDVKDELLGKEGTPGRDKHEQDVKEAVHAYHIGEAIKEVRLRSKLTQEQLGARVGVKKAQISRIEKGSGISIPTMSKVFKALGVTSGSLDLGRNGKIALW